MKKFWKFLLRKSLPADSLTSLKFAVIGLGDSSYLKFNFVAKKLHKRLVQLGATSILSVGLCDDQHDLGIGAVLSPFLEDFWKKNPLPLGLSPREMRATRWKVNRVCTFAPIDENIDIYGDFEETSAEGFLKVLVGFDFYEIIHIYLHVFNLQENKRTTSEEHFQDVRLISFKCNNLKWNVGDVAYIRPRNSLDNVDRLFDVFKEHNLNLGSQYVMLEGDDGESINFSDKRMRFLNGQVVCNA